MSTIQEIISRVDDVKINAYSEKAKTGWISQVEGWIKDKVIQTFNFFEISRIKDQAAYDLPAGVNFMNVVMGFFEGYPIQKIDARSFNKIGYFLDGSGKLNIYPVPGVDDTQPGLRFVCKWAHVPFRYPDDKDQELLVPAPYDKIYDDYVMAMIDWSNREYGAYNNSMIMYNASFDEVRKWYKQTNPIPDTQIRNLW
jgi:hypothetical protein